MKLTLSLVTLVFLTGCSQNTLFDKNKDSRYSENLYQEISNSYQTWLQLKAKNSATYSYDRDTDFKEGFHNSTKISIENDLVENRHFFEWQTGSTPSLSWSESYASLNTHDQGAPTKTLDQLYHQCESEIFNKSSYKYNKVLVTDTLGVLKQCSYTLKQCSANCTKGINIKALTLY